MWQPLRFIARSSIIALLASSVLVRPALAGDPPAKPPRIEDFAPPEEFVVAGGIKTHFVKRGESGPPIVLVHGFGSCTYTWRLNLDALAARGYRVYAIDVKGFGLTEKPKDGKYSLGAFTHHLLDFLDVMKLERPILVGNSMGGALITRLALAHPERVGGVVLVDPAPPEFSMKSAAGTLIGSKKPSSPIMAEPPPAVALLRDRLGSSLARSLVTRDLIEKGLRGAYHDPKFVTPEAIEVYYRPILIEGAAEALMALSGSPLAPPEPVPPLKTLKVPALIVWGRHDRVIPVTLADHFTRELPGAKRVILENSGHMPHEEEAPAFNDLVVEFARSALSKPR